MLGAWPEAAERLVELVPAGLFTWQPVARGWREELRSAAAARAFFARQPICVRSGARGGACCRAFWGGRHVFSGRVGASRRASLCPTFSVNISKPHPRGRSGPSPRGNPFPSAPEPGRFSLPLIATTVVRVVCSRVVFHANSVAGRCRGWCVFRSMKFQGRETRVEFIPIPNAGVGRGPRQGPGVCAAPPCGGGATDPASGAVRRPVEQRAGALAVLRASNSRGPLQRGAILDDWGEKRFEICQLELGREDSVAARSEILSSKTCLAPAFDMVCGSRCVGLRRSRRA